ncbi:zinc-dependent alcohol dehydrogenase [Actinomadura fibrosa]|uniref:Zinc-binding dehydrogenase n=1 Tax=Actinomadura fibrosa TaxID=111802 RepID=A0ABW2XIY0_9ACTN|nr:alcohol dehydrogenase catalytic domain-containing protein [Actinomadura fibrosa]
MSGPGSQALVIDRPGTYRLVPHRERPPGPGEALVRVHAVGVCGSDRELLNGTRPAGYARYPVVPGHEWSGTVEAVGPDVPAALTGRKVVGEGFRNCQVCERCHTGEPTLCTAGYEETGFTVPGAMAPTLTLPSRLLHPLPEDADLTAAALLEPAACAAAAALRAGARPGDRVAVVGTGALGLLTAQLLAAVSPRLLTVIGRHPERAGQARACGAHEYRTSDRLDGTGGFDVVVEAAGAPDSARTAAALLRRGGRLVLTGIPAPGAAGPGPAELVVRQLDVRTVFGAPPAAWAHAVRAFAAGLLDPLPLITHRLPLTAFEEAIALVRDDPAVGKVVLHPDGVPTCRPVLEP